jgi:hypothetical protein
MVISWALAVVTTIIVTLGVHYGIGHHTQYVVLSGGIPKLEKALEMTWLTAPFSTMSACIGKISVALLLMRILRPKRAMSLFLWFIIVTLFLVNIMLTVITFAQCTPVTYLWLRIDPTVKGHCWNPKIQTHYGIFQGSYSAFTDVILAIIPIFALWKLQTKLNVKIGVMLLLSFGIIAGAAAVVKTINLPELANPDFTYVPVHLTYWYLTENWLIVIAGCIPTLRPLWTDASTRWKSYMSRSKASKITGNSSDYYANSTSKKSANAMDSRVTIGGGGQNKPRMGTSEVDLFTTTSANGDHELENYSPVSANTGRGRDVEAQHHI